MGAKRFLILKTAAVALCVVVLAATGCRGGIDKATAVNNKSIEIKGVQGNVQGNGKEDIEAVVGSVRHKGTGAKDLRNDIEREKKERTSDRDADGEAQQPEDEGSVAGEEDRGTDAGSEITGAGEGYEDDSAVYVYSISEMDGWDTDESESELWDDERADDEGLEYEDAVVEGTGEYDYDSEYGEEPVSEPEVPGESVETVEEESYDDGWVYYGTAFITHFCPCSICCGAYASGYTASGAWATEGRTVAAGYSIPFGTEVMINGNVYVVEDRGVDDGVFDVFVSDHDTALAMGAYYTDVYIR